MTFDLNIHYRQVHSGDLNTGFYTYRLNLQVLSWKRSVDGLKDGEIVVVNEFVSVDQDKRQILMSASDSSLIKTKYYPSLSLHDFEAEDGMVRDLFIYFLI